MDPNLDPRALAQQNSYLDAIRQRMGMGGQPSGLLGSGMAQGAAQAMQMDPYRKHVQEAQALGQQPMPPEVFMQQMQTQRPQGRGLLGL